MDRGKRSRTYEFRSDFGLKRVTGPLAKCAYTFHPNERGRKTSGGSNAPDPFYEGGSIMLSVASRGL